MEVVVQGLETQTPEALDEVEEQAQGDLGALQEEGQGLEAFQIQEVPQDVASPQEASALAVVEPCLEAQVRH